MRGPEQQPGKPEFLELLESEDQAERRDVILILQQLRSMRVMMGFRERPSTGSSKDASISAQATDQFVFAADPCRVE